MCWLSADSVIRTTLTLYAVTRSEMSADIPNAFFMTALIRRGF